MTDAAVPITQSAVERFTEQYLRSLGCTIEKRGDRWEITTTEAVDSELLAGNLTLACGDDDNDEDSVESLHPESPFFQQILSEASERNPTGKISIETSEANIEIPSWLRESDVEVSEADFTPYYDRAAIVVLFRVGIETVSEYQSQLLRAAAMDIRSEEYLPSLEQAFLEITSLDKAATTGEPTELEAEDVDPLLDTAGEHLIDRIQGTVDEIHQEASRAADAEVEEYRQMQQQRVQELEKDHSNLSDKIDNLSQRISSSDENERVEALKERKELKSKYESIDTELTELRQRRDQGFPERQREIRNRHALDIRISPLTITEIEYERGEIEFKLVSEESTRTVTVGYGSGVGVTEDIHCASCGGQFTERNHLYDITSGCQCRKCSKQAK